MIVEGGHATRLQRVPLFERDFKEAYLQQLLFEHPALLPIDELEPMFGGLIPLGREVPTPAGPIDLLYVNAEAFLTIVETKLWRNPGAVRDVFAQIIDYVKELARWSYDDLEQAAQSAGVSGLPSGRQPLLALVAAESDELDERAFLDQMCRNLRLGRVLLLIVGDGIREGVERMAEFLQQTPQLGFTLGLIEIGLFRTQSDKPDSLFVQPRIIARTREITRAVVEIRCPIRPDDVVVSVPPEAEAAGPTLDRFYEHLTASAGPEVVKFVKWSVAEAETRQLEVVAKEHLRFWYENELTGDKFPFGFLRKNGLYEARSLVKACEQAGVPREIGTGFLDEVARLIGAQRVAIIGASRDETLRMPGGGFPPLAKLIPVKDQWFALIDRAVNDIKDALERE